VFVPVTTMFLVKYVGLDKLTNAYGLLSMVKGFASMVGPPVAGMYRSRNAFIYINKLYIYLYKFAY